MTVPVVDLTAADAAARFVEALRTAACAWVTNHGIPAGVCADVHEQSLAFFDLPREEKAAVQWDGQGLWRGWQPVLEGGAEYGGAARPTELLERFEVNTLAGTPATGTRWPAAPAELRPAWLSYLGHAGALASRLVTLVAGELDLPRSDLPAWTDGQFANLVANHYPPQPEPPEPGRLRVTPHLDHGGLTLLLVDDAPGGLEAETPTGWEPVQALAGAILVQGGELLGLWSGGQLRANRHRVVNPPREAALSRRLSVIWFHHPDLGWRLTDGRTAGEVVHRRQDEYRGAA